MAGRWRVVALLGVGLLTGACASSQEWSDWREHTSHFASGQHGWFSMRNQAGKDARVTRADVDSARSEGWWGRPVTVSSEQILQN
jgi:hypothetical protein